MWIDDSAKSAVMFTVREVFDVVTEKDSTSQ